MREVGAKDLGLAAFVLLLQSVPFAFSIGRPGPPWTLVEYAPVVATALPLIWRRRAPFSCLLIIVIGIEVYAIVGEDGPSQPIWYGGLLAIYTVAVLARRSQRIAAMAIIVIGVVVAVGSVSTGVRETLTWGAAYALGAMTRARGELAARNARQTAELAAERERTRIARDLHDILGHAFSVMVVQAEAGAMTTGQNPRAQTAFRAISDTGREAMTQLRATVGTLRRPDPSLADLAELVRTTERGGGGIRVSLTVRGDPRPLAADVQLVGYRVVQEALTNSLKHSGATTVEVAVRWGADEVRLTVTDDGTGPGPPRTGPGPSGALVDNGGFGLKGMSARAAEVGGAVTYGPRLDARGFVVQAVLG